MDCIPPIKDFTYNMAKMKVRKAVFPAGGLGTRFLPATKALPKEMLPLVDKPLVQYGVEEAIAAGCDQIILITGRDKAPMEDHFDISYELEDTLRARGKTKLLGIAEYVSRLGKIAYLRQKQALGLGHAVLQAKELIGDEPFAVLLPDDVIDATVPCLKQMVEVFDEMQGSVLATQVVEGEAISAYGVLDCDPVPGREHLCKVKDMVEKPNFSDAPSKNAIIGRYILTPKIFECLEATKPGAGGEIQLTDGIKLLLRSESVYGFDFDGTRHDAGDKLGFLKATVTFALKRDDLGPDFRSWLKELTTEL